MTNYHFYEIRTSAAVEDSLVRRSFQPREGDPITLFVWEDQRGSLQQFQLLMAERFVEWTPGGIVCGHTNRAHTGPSEIARGVRTMHADRDDAVLGDARGVLAASDFPDGLGSTLRECLQAH